MSSSQKLQLLAALGFGAVLGGAAVWGFDSVGRLQRTDEAGSQEQFDQGELELVADQANFLARLSENFMRKEIACSEEIALDAVRYYHSTSRNVRVEAAVTVSQYCRRYQEAILSPTRDLAKRAVDSDELQTVMLALGRINMMAQKEVDEFYVSQEFADTARYRIYLDARKDYEDHLKTFKEQNPGASTAALTKWDGLRTGVDSGD